MAFIVECVRGSPDESGFETCGISTFAWDKLLPLAERHGWKPAGCVFDRHPEPSEPQLEQPTDYHWDDWGHCKRISADDARNLAAALHRAVAAGIPPGSGPTLSSDSGFVDPGLAGSARKLAAFAARGGFVFAVDD